MTTGVFANQDETVQENSDVKTKIQQTINKYILDVYKSQGDKILEELDANLAKVATTKEARFESYMSIQKTLQQKKKSVEKDQEMWKNAKTLLIKYLDYMVSEIENRKKNL